MKKSLLFLLPILCFDIHAEVLSQWRGPQRDGKYPEHNLMTAWPAGDPQKLWSASGLGIGYSSPAVTSQAVYVTSLVGENGILFALDHQGKLLWKTTYGKEWNGGHEGARSTPTVVDDRIYLISGVGTAVCLTTAGKVVWSVDLLKTFG
ncbi:MAG: PQQ-like beta-propeller repeat protein, partial [candidate division KSB1 bacterium]|nr:PQQ-like beta-propeller repeat protein [candidate division KSB1 bacterium]